ncbi:hypothetical protein KAM461_21550 [Aeromonas hydrophila]|nr:hypothetical protein KAM461_21550 [Aeromonas hydrophila]
MATVFLFTGQVSLIKTVPMHPSWADADPTGQFGGMQPYGLTLVQRDL